MRLLVNKSKKLRDLNNPSSWGIEPESSFLKRYKVVSEEKMSFLFYAPKEENEVEEKDETFFPVFEGRDEELFCKWSKKGEVVSVGGK